MGMPGCPSLTFVDVPSHSFSSWEKVNEMHDASHV
jgi:hypothetical protein